MYIIYELELKVKSHCEYSALRISTPVKTRHHRIIQTVNFRIIAAVVIQTE